MFPTFSQTTINYLDESQADPALLSSPTESLVAIVFNNNEPLIGGRPTAAALLWKKTPKPAAEALHDEVCKNQQHNTAVNPVTTVDSAVLPLFVSSSSEVKISAFLLVADDDAAAVGDLIHAFLNLDSRPTTGGGVPFAKLHKILLLGYLSYISMIATGITRTEFPKLVSFMWTTTCLCIPFVQGSTIFCLHIFTEGQYRIYNLILSYIDCGTPWIGWSLMYM